jgi:hypothetical protein
MKVNHWLSRGAKLSAFLLAIGIASASHAGVIPWVYDAIFGPVRYPAYGYGYGCGPCGVSYARPVAIRSSRGCGPCGQSYAMAGSCSPYSLPYNASANYAGSSLACGPCGAVVTAGNSGCGTECGVIPAGGTADPKSSGSGQATWNSTKKIAEPEPDKAPQPRTFEEPLNLPKAPNPKVEDGFETQIRSRHSAKPASGLGGTENHAAPSNSGTNPNRSSIQNPKKAPTTDFDHLFEPPLENTKPTDSANPGNDSATIIKPRARVNLDSKITWEATPHFSRTPVFARIAKASVARHVPGQNDGWTPVPSRSFGPQLARK